MHPYEKLPPSHFWAKSVSRAFAPEDVGAFPRPLIRRQDKVVTAGSCFAANLIPYLIDHGIEYVRTEFLDSIYSKVEPERFSYAKFSAGYGNIYTTRQLLQLLQRCTGEFQPVEDKWISAKGVVDPFRPGLRYIARSEREFHLLTQQHLAATLEAFKQCDVFIFTLGLTEAWASVIDDAVFPACPGTVEGTFDPARHRFVNFNALEVISDMRLFIEKLRVLNPTARIILTVSPVPLVATASHRHVLSATIYSKSVLRVAAETLVFALENVFYFPAYEIVTGPQAPEEYFESDKRNVSEAGVKAVMQAFLSACEKKTLEEPQTKAPEIEAAVKLSEAIVEFECEEAAQSSVAAAGR